MDMSFFYMNAQRVISNVLLLLTLVVLSPHSIADDKKPDANDFHHPTISVGTQSAINESAYYDDEKNLTKLAEKVSSLNKEKRDAIDILDKVDSFYSKSFNTLLLLITAMIGIVGGVIPFVISLYQARLIKKENINLQESISNEVDSRLSKLKEELRVENENRAIELKSNISDGMRKMEDKYNDEIKKLRAESLGKISNVIAGTFLINKVYRESAIFYFQAGLNYMTYKSHSDLKNVIKHLVKKVVPNLSPDDSDVDVNERYKKFIDRLSLFNTESMYDDSIEELKSVWMEFLKRVENNDEKL